MAIIYQAQITPTKLELIAPWLAAQSWHPGGSELESVGAFRFDDPYGDVGIETHLLGAGDNGLLQVPVTYRPVPLPDGEPFLLGTMEHSVLGRRWVYDGCGDPVYTAALLATILGIRSQAEEIIHIDDRREPREPSARVTGTGDVAGTAAGTSSEEPPTAAVGTTVAASDGYELTLRRVLEPALGAAGLPALTGTWAGADDPVVLATARRF